MKSLLNPRYWTILLLILMGEILWSGHDTFTKLGEWGTGNYYDVAVQGDYAFCAATGAGLDILDISSSVPVRVSSIDLRNFAFGVVLNGDFAYVGCFGRFLIVDISNIASSEGDVPLVVESGGGFVDLGIGRVNPSSGERSFLVSVASFQPWVE